MMVNYDVRDYANLIDHTGLFISHPPPPTLKFVNKKGRGEGRKNLPQAPCINQPDSTMEPPEGKIRKPCYPSRLLRNLECGTQIYGFKSYPAGRDDS